MTATLPLLRGRITLSGALTEDRDILQELSYPEKRINFWLHLYGNRPQIENLVARHLHLSRQDFRLGDVKEWIHGSFNVCLPVHILESPRTANLPRKVLIRFPLPYKIGAEFDPANVDEKLRCEAATYVWLQSHCPAVPTARLFGFGFPGGRSFTLLERSSLFDRIKWYFRCGIAYLFGSPLPPRYIAHTRRGLLDSGYLVLEYVQEGRMLSDLWKPNQTDPELRSNLFGGLSRIMLHLAACPMPRIGAWTMDDEGHLSLTNRPLTYSLHYQENLGIPTNIPRDQTYTSAVPYYLDLLACRDNVLRHQPNSIHDDEDGRSQLAALATMRTVLPTFSDRQHRDGPFALLLTDVHPSNIFVDDDWNITKIIDLEWACARPLEMLSPPSWLSGQCLDQIQFEKEEEYAALHAEFVRRFEQEELAFRRSRERTQMLQKCWESGAFWYFHAIDAPSALLDVCTDHIQPRFVASDSSQREFDSVVASLWDVDVPRFLAAKIEEQERYSGRLREMFLTSGTESRENDKGNSAA